MHKLTHSAEMRELVQFIFHFTLIFSLVVFPHLIVTGIASALGLS